MLEELYSESGLLNRDVEFRHGLNIVLGKYGRDKQESGINGIGKSSLVRLIDYALLSESADKLFAQKRYDFLRDEHHTITLKLKILGDSHYIRRSFGKKKGVIEFGTSPNRLADFEAREIRSILIDKMFPITDESVRYEGERFRTLFNFFVKDDLDQRLRSDPLDFFPYRAAAHEKFAYNFFLLGLPNDALFKYGSHLKHYGEQQKFVKALTEQVERSTGKKLAEFKSERLVLEQRVSLLERSLRDYRFLEKYKDIEASLSAINDKINDRLKAFHSYSRKLRRLRELSCSTTEIDVSEVASMYEELSSAFASLVKKRLDEIIAFKTTLIENRLRHNLERERHLESSLRTIELDITALENQRAALMRQLEEKGELDSIANTYEELAAEKSALEKNVQALRKIDETNGLLRKIDIEISEARVSIYEDIQGSEDKLNDLRSLFREIVENAILTSTDLSTSAYFDVSATSGTRRNQIPFNVRIEVPKSDALGRFNLKLVAYDLLVFLHSIRTQRQLPRFLVHDGVFHGIAKRTMVDTLNYVSRQSQLYPGFQYIVTFNEDEIYIPDERKELDGALIFDLDDVTVAKFTDSDSGMIFKRAFV